LEQAVELRELRSDRLAWSIRSSLVDREAVDAEEAKRIKESEEAAFRKQYKAMQLQVLMRTLQCLTPEFKSHVLEGKDPKTMNDHDIDRAVSHYSWYRFHHDFMRSIIDAVQVRDTLTAFPVGYALHARAYIDPDGRFRPKLAPIMEALDGVEVDRIRACLNKNCRRIFWAGRVAKPGSTKNDQVCCSPECSHAARNQRLRARYTDSTDDYAARKLTANERWTNKQARRKGE
jgi:hypothetical protein